MNCTVNANVDQRNSEQDTIQGWIVHFQNGLHVALKFLNFCLKSNAPNVQCGTARGSARASYGQPVCDFLQIRLNDTHAKPYYFK